MPGSNVRIDIVAKDEATAALSPLCPKRIARVYVAGPLTARTRWEEEQNVRNAEAVGRRVAEIGAYPVIPHANTRPTLFSELNGPEWWYAATLQMVHLCDAVIMVPGWSQSVGATRERDEAEAAGIPVFLHIRELEGWINTWREKGGVR